MPEIACYVRTQSQRHLSIIGSRSNSKSHQWYPHLDHARSSVPFHTKDTVRNAFLRFSASNEDTTLSSTRLPACCKACASNSVLASHLSTRVVQKKKHEARRLPLPFGSLFVRVQTRSSSLSDPRRLPSNSDTDPNRSFPKRRCVETWCRRWRWRRPLVRICSAKQRRSRRV